MEPFFLINTMRVESLLDSWLSRDGVQLFESHHLDQLLKRIATTLAISISSKCHHLRKLDSSNSLANKFPLVLSNCTFKIKLRLLQLSDSSRLFNCFCLLFQDKSLLEHFLDEQICS